MGARIMKRFSWQTDSEDEVTFEPANVNGKGWLAVSEDGSSERGIALTPSAAVNLASALLQWATKNGYGEK